MRTTPRNVLLTLAGSQTLKAGVDQIHGRKCTMPKHTIVLRREGIQGFLSTQSLGTDAYNAMTSIPGVSNPEIVKESDKLVEIAYEWTGKGKFWQTGEHLLKFGLARADNQ